MNLKKYLTEIIGFLVLSLVASLVFNSVSDKEKHKMDNKVWDEGKQTFKNSFVNRYSQLLERSILMTMDRIIQDKESDDDW